MELPILLGIAFVIWLLFGPVVALMRASEAKKQAEDTEVRFRETLRVQTERLDRLVLRVEKLESAARSAAIATQRAEQKPIEHQQEVAAPPPAEEPPPVHVKAEPPPLPPAPEPIYIAASSPILQPPPAIALMKPAVEAPPDDVYVVSATPIAQPPEFKRTVPPVRKPDPEPMNFERFMGEKLIGWAGGLALFLCVIFFVKQAIQYIVFPPELRVAMGFLTGLGLLTAGVWVQKRKAYEVLAHTFCATGVLVLYGVTFACYTLYHFQAFNSGVTFGLMTLITAVAFLLAVRMNTQVVAVLGMLGGFLTPILCSTGEDHPFGLFGYIALLDLGLLAVAKHRRWLHLTALAATGTALMQFGWLSKFGYSGHYFEGSSTWVIVTIFLGFAALFAAAAKWSEVRDFEDMYPSRSALGLCASAMIAAFIMLGAGTVAERPILLYTFVLLINATGLFITWSEPRVRLAPTLICATTFVHLMAWTVGSLTSELLPYALGIYLVFGLLHTAFGVLWQRKYPELSTTAANWMPVIILLMGLLPIFVLKEVSFIIWPALLITNVLVIGLALYTRKLMPVLASIGITMFAAAAWLMKLPQSTNDSLFGFLMVIGGFAVFFIAASVYLIRRTSQVSGGTVTDPLAQLLPVSSAVLPFLLLIMATLQLPVTNPSPVFGLALLLTVFLLGLARLAGMHMLSMAALLCTLALEEVWHGRHFNTESPVVPLVWYLGFYALFTAFPFVFRKLFERTKTPWIAAAVASLGTFGLVHQLIAETWPNNMMGLLPAAFAIPSLLSLVAVIKLHRDDNPARLDQLACFGGVALFFITLIFPMQFDRQWITIGWAFEGAALVWLFRRVPHQGLLYTGAGLLVVSFARLALNPAVLTYAHHSGTPILNWFLYSYGLVAAAQIIGAQWLREPHTTLGTINLRSLFSTFGGVLLFLLLNIEIADAFTPDGANFVTFELGGNLARDMTYSIGWGLFALGLLLLGFWKNAKPIRYAGIGLLVVTLLKLFLHDLASINNVYRIGALMAVAVIALFSSFLYQRFFSANNTDR